VLAAKLAELAKLNNNASLAYRVHVLKESHLEAANMVQSGYAYQWLVEKGREEAQRAYAVRR
jgi:hypothetical protein